jgi:hypothetical protein
MRNIVVNGIVPAICAAVLSLLLFVQIPLRAPMQLQMLLYPLVRQAALEKITFQTRGMEVYETPHFSIRYLPADSDVVEMTAQAAEAAYAPVTDAFGFTPSGKTLMVLYPDRQKMSSAFGWSGNEAAMGVYWAGVIELLSPHAWLQSGQTAADFAHSGPIVHEYTHLVFDHMTNGNYPRWFTEGLAQYMEYKINGYEWQTPDNKLDGSLYTMNDLDDHYDQLSNQALAYRESLATIRYIVAKSGDGGLRKVIGLLQTGKSMKTAIKEVLGVDYSTFEQDWQQWAKVNMEVKE